jgi:hypothetical protein
MGVIVLGYCNFLPILSKIKDSLDCVLQLKQLTDSKILFRKIIPVSGVMVRDTKSVPTTEGSDSLSKNELSQSII